MKFSVCIAAFGMVGLKKIIDTSAKLGYDTVEFTAALRLSTKSTSGRRKEVLGRIHDAGIVYSALYHIFNGTIRLLSMDSEMMNQSAAYLRQVANVAYDIECPTVVMESGGEARSSEPDWDKEAGVKCMAEIVRQAGLYAQEKGVTLAVEAIDRHETSFLSTSEEAVNFVNMVNLPNMRTMVNIYYLNIRKVNPVEAIRDYGHALANLHLTDSNRQASGGGHFGSVSVVEALWEADFKRYHLFEVFGPYLWGLRYDTLEEPAGHTGSSVKYARPVFG